MPGRLECLHDRTELANFLGEDPVLNIYALGDLDDFFWPRTTWYGWRQAEQLTAALLVYASPGLPTVLAAARPEGAPALRALIRAAAPLLPSAFHAHVSPELTPTLQSTGWTLTPHGRLLRMGLTDHDAMARVPHIDAEPLGPEHNGELRSFYATAYPDNWFDPQMLHTHSYLGVRRDGRLVAVAGVHAVSDTQECAALGNIAVAPGARRQGLGVAITAALCSALHGRGLTIGLNVRAHNEAAISCYGAMGFRVETELDDLTARR